MGFHHYVLLLTSIQLCYQAVAWQCSNCVVPYKAVGCSQDSPARALKEQVLNERDPDSNVYDGNRIDWTNWNNYMPAFACRCAKIVKAKGYTVFGLQFYGECWSGAPGTFDLDKMKTSESCIGDDYKPCGHLDRNCIGNQWTNFIFELVPDCDVEIERIGCFKDNQKAPRPLPDYIMTDREAKLSIYSGQSIDWRNWDVYLPNFVCRCAQSAKEKGHDTFGVQYYGECWSGLHGEQTYSKLGISNKCQDKCFDRCRPYEKYCAGKNFANAVYRLADAPCEIAYQPVGCHGEDPSNRAFTKELLNEMKPNSPRFNGVVMEFGNNWQKGFTRFLCRCARAAHLKGYSMFGVYEHGECWSDVKAEQKYNKHGPSDKCFQNYNQTCPEGFDACAGGEEANYVYQIATNERRSFLEDETYETGRLTEMFDLDDTSIEAEALRRKRSKNKAVKQNKFN